MMHTQSKEHYVFKGSFVVPESGDEAGSSCS